MSTFGDTLLVTLSKVDIKRFQFGPSLVAICLWKFVTIYFSFIFGSQPREHNQLAGGMQYIITCVKNIVVMVQFLMSTTTSPWRKAKPIHLELLSSWNYNKGQSLIDLRQETAFDLELLLSSLDRSLMFHEYQKVENHCPR